MNDELIVSELIIIPIEGAEYIHFVVLDRMNKESAIVYDPEIGKVNMPIYELKHRWNGYALLIGG
ncbi:cysteine peptidase family C39 domain-containing protein [Dickeya lacustris]|uniref:Cysteine peptidase family C39 domain-containing protein n=1 Tax=Dickeya lacustris TaxID=2259638 RepID=A0ABY8G2X6_9GAMM|nr:cysteine peptidase family C39 domain-containing protein [Dickeya lacustris]WFN54304.1 cysteine peptidase family C39 domain-containing protein [Dickeya lacustris]